jgi:protoheme IX farnesyltransferase
MLWWTELKPSSSYGRMSTFQHWLASVLTIVGITLLYMINPKTAMFGAISIFLYTSVYTPLKRSHHYPFLWVLFRSYSVYVRFAAATAGFCFGTFFLIQFFCNSPFLGNWLVLVWRLSRFLCCQQAKTRVPLCRLFCIGWLL